MTSLTVNQLVVFKTHLNSHIDLSGYGVRRVCVQYLGMYTWTHPIERAYTKYRTTKVSEDKSNRVLMFQIMELVICVGAAYVYVPGDPQRLSLEAPELLKCDRNQILTVPVKWPQPLK